MQRMKWITSIVQPTVYGRVADAGLLILRMGIGSMMLAHGWGKLNNFAEYADGFINFLGLGGSVSLALTIFAEFFCSLFLIVGIATRLILIPLIILTIVIAFVVHGPDSFSDKEHGLLFMVAYLSLFLTGPGRYSLDYFLFSGTKAT